MGFAHKPIVAGRFDLVILWHAPATGPRIQGSTCRSESVMVGLETLEMIHILCRKFSMSAF